MQGIEFMQNYSKGWNYASFHCNSNKVKYMEIFTKHWLKFFWPFLPTTAITFNVPLKKTGIKNFTYVNQHIVG